MPALIGHPLAMVETQGTVSSKTTVLLLRGSDNTRTAKPTSFSLDSEGRLVAEWPLPEIRDTASFRLRFLGPLAIVSVRHIVLEVAGMTVRAANTANGFEWICPPYSYGTVRSRKGFRFFAGTGLGEIQLSPQPFSGSDSVLRLEIDLVYGKEARDARVAYERRQILLRKSLRAVRRPDRVLSKAVSVFFVPRARKVIDRIRGIFTTPDFSQMGGKNGLILVLSHTDPDVSMGGTEKYICEMRSYASARGYNLAVLSPIRRTDSFLKPGKKWLGLNYQGASKGIFRLDRLKCAIQTAPPTVVHIHHLRNWNLESLEAILAVSAGAPLHVHLHDFFALCPQAHVPCFNSSDHALCQSTSVTTPFHRCLSEIGEAGLQKWNAAFENILRRAEHVYAPSEFVKRLYLQQYPALERALSTLAHAHFGPAEPPPEVAVEKTSKIRLALLGYASWAKGWKLWLSLLENPDLIARYEFFHIGGNPADYAGQWVKVLRYSFHDAAKDQAVELLKKERIQLALLWSQIPESYSYTLQEAKAAGVPVLTSHLSGNLAERVKSEGPDTGAVFDSESELVAFLTDDARVRALMAKPRKCSALTYHPPEYLRSVEPIGGR